MASWSELTAAAPSLAALARARIEATGLALMATLRGDGSPRISGIEPLFAADDLWLGMMPGSRKVADLRRDPRLALHNATVDKQVSEGDVKIAGRAVAVIDGAQTAAYRAAFEAATGYPPPPGPFDLFRVDVSELSSVRPEGDHLVIDWWRPGGPPHRVERR